MKTRGNSRFGGFFLFGLWRDAPPFRLLLGLCPALAVTTSALNGMTMALAVIFVLTCSSLVVSLVRRMVPHQVRIPTFVMIIATFVTIVDLFLQGWFPALSRALGPYIPLIIVNCLILGRAEAFASKNGPAAAAADALGHGCGFLWALLLVGSFREILGQGTLFGRPVTGPGFEPLVIMLMPAGAFLTLGMMVGLINWLGSAGRRRRPGPVPEARR